MSPCRSFCSQRPSQRHRLGPLPAAPNKDHTKGRTAAPNSQTSCVLCTSGKLRGCFLVQSHVFSMWFGAGPARNQASRGDGLVDFKTQCWLEVLLPKCTPNPAQCSSYVPIKHSVTLQQWTFVKEVETDNWVKAVWNISPTRRKQQRMRHTAVSQLNSLLSRNNFTLFISWKPLLHVYFQSLKQGTLFFLPRFKDFLWHAWICHLASSFVSSNKNQRIQKKDRLAVWISCYFSEGEKSLELGSIFLQHAAQTADEEKSF